MYIRLSEDVQDVLWTSYVGSIYKDSNRPEFFRNVPKSSTTSRSPEIQFTCPELMLFLPLSKKTLNSYSFIHQTCSSTNLVHPPLPPLQVLPSLNISSPGGGVYQKAVLRQCLFTLATWSQGLMSLRIGPAQRF